MTLIPRSPAPRKVTASLIAVGLLAFSVVGLLAQSTPYLPILERQLWKQLLPWGLNRGANGEIIWVNRKDLNNIPSSSAISTGEVDEYGDLIYRSVTPYGSTPQSSIDAANFEFLLLGAIGECTYSHAADYDINYAIYFPQVRLCKGPEFPLGSGVYAKLPPAPGRLLNPVGIAISGKKVFVADLFNHRVEAFDFFGNNIPMKYPIGNGIPGVDFYNYDVTYPGLNYRPYASVPGFAAFNGGYSGHQLSAPAGIAADARKVLGQESPRLLIADSDNYRLALFNDDGSVAFGTQAAPVHVLLPVPADSQGVPILDPVGNPFKPDQVAISAGAVVRAPGTVIAPGDPDYLKRIVVADRVHCYLAIMDVGFNVIKTLPPALPLATQHDACQNAELAPTLPGEFTTITGVKVDQSGTIYVADHANNAVRVFDRSGNLVTSIGQPGGTNPGGAGALRGPVGVFIDEQFGRLGVIDEGNARAVFYGIAGGPAAVTYEFQIDTTVAVDDFPMGVAMQFGAEADGLDPKGRIMVTDPIRRRVLRWELPELVIANASATITGRSGKRNLGIGSFDVVVPYQKLSPVLDVIVDVQPQLPGSVAVVPGSIVPSLALRPAIQFGQLVHYTFQFTSTIAEAKFDITARGDCDAGGANCLAVAPGAVAVARALCGACAATHEVYYDQPLDPQNPVLAVLVDTPDKIESGRTITGWYNQPVFVRIHPVVPPGIPDNDPNRVTRIAWSYGGIGGQFYGTSVTETPAFNASDRVDVIVRVAGATWVTYQAITYSGSISAPVEVLLPVDFSAPTMLFTQWLPLVPSGVDGALQWYNTPVRGTYQLTDPHSGPQAPPNGGVLTFASEGRDQFVLFPMVDLVGNSAVADSHDLSRGGKIVNIDMTAPTFPAGPFSFDVIATGNDGSNYADIPANFLFIAATDPLLSNGGLGSRPGTSFGVGNLAATLVRDGGTIMFRATDNAGNSALTTATVRVRAGVLKPTVATVTGVVYTYNGTPRPATCTITGNSYSFPGTLTYSPVNLVPVNAGTVTATCSFAGNDFYAPATTVTAEVVIRKAVPVAKIIGGTFTYDGTPRPATCTVAGINGDTFAGTISYAPVNAVPVNAGTVQATCSFAGNGNYEAAVAVTAPVTITKINATVTAGSGSKTYGAVDPALSSATTTGFIGTDGITTSQTRAAGENVGSYTVTAVATGAALVNYNVVSTPGTFSITRATVTVTAGGGNKVYGTADPALTATTQVGFLPGDVAGITLSSTRAAGNNVGSYATTPTASGGNIANYVITPVAGTFSITKATLIVTADNKTRPRGAFNPALTSTITGFVSGDTAAVVGGSAALSTTAVAASPAGTYPITASVGSLVAANYSFIFVGATLTVTPQINLPPTCGTATGGEIWPPNHKKFYAAPINGVRDPEGTFLTITVTGIWQDEPIDSTGDGNFSPDGQGIGTGTAWVRAERNGHQNTAVGDGRVYEIFFSATDGVSLCTGSVFYTVPHDQGQRSTAIDSGVRFDSTGVIPGARDKSQIHQKSPTP